MGAPVTQFINITVNLQGAVAAKFGFGTPIEVHTHSISTKRIEGPFIDITGVNEAGFTAAAAPEINAAATAAFSVANGVDKILIGRRIPTLGAYAGSVLQVSSAGPNFVDQTDEFNNADDADWDVFPATNVIGDYAAIGYPDTFDQVSLDNANGTPGIGGVVVWEYWDGSAWAALSGVTDNTTSFTAAVSDAQDVTWTVPGDWAEMSLDGEPEQFYVRPRITTVYGTLPVYDQGHVDGPGDATWTDTMDAIELYQQQNGTENFYGVNVETRVKADILEVAAWTQARSKVFGAQTADADAKAGTPGNVIATLKGLGYDRVWCSYHSESSGSASAYADAAWMSRGLGLDLDVPGGVGIWGFMELAGIAGDNLTPTEAINIWGDNGNIFTDTGELVFTSEGTTAKGKPQFIDVTTSVDWLTFRSEEGILSLLVGVQTKIPYTNGGITQVQTAWQAVLDAAVRNGHLSNDEEDLPKITAPTKRQISDEDKGLRKLTMTATATLAGAVQAVVLVLNVSF